jgi:ADP-ribose pyrophosphatase YjhB (NUDIX family)
MNQMSVRAIIEHQGKFLLCQIKSQREHNYWCLPGGRVEAGEDILSTLTREIIEETGIEPKVGELLYVHQIQTPNGYLLPEFFFHIQNGEDYLNLDISNTSHGALELDKIEFVDIESIRLLPSFLQPELPKLIKNRFSTPTQIRLSKLEN